MLTQRMAKAACFAHTGVKTEMHMSMLKDADALFRKTLTGLSDGDSAQGMLKESNAEILANLSQVAGLWTDFATANDHIIANNAVALENLNIIANTNVAVLRQMHKTVGVIEKTYGSSGTVHPALALALNVSGRQRMLSQRASKEFCFIAAGIETENNRAALRETVDLFSTSIDGLINGDAASALAPAPTPQIKAQLEKVKGMWATLKPIFEKAISNQALSPSEIEKVATDNNPLLVEMNKAVTMYNNI